MMLGALIVYIALVLYITVGVIVSILDRERYDYPGAAAVLERVPLWPAFVAVWWRETRPRWIVTEGRRAGWAGTEPTDADDTITGQFLTRRGAARWNERQGSRGRVVRCWRSKSWPLDSADNPNRRTHR
jgi:hypothetical protein